MKKLSPTAFNKLILVPSSGWSVGFDYAKELLERINRAGFKVVAK